MVDNGDNTYSYSYTISRPGGVTIQVLQYLQGGVYFEWYPNTDLAGQPSGNEIVSTVSQDWAYGVVFNGLDQMTSAKVYFKINPPVSEIYNFEVSGDDLFKLYLDDNLFVQADYSGARSASTALTTGVFHNFYAEYMEYIEAANFAMKWSYPSQGLQIIPNTYLYYPQLVGTLIHKEIL